MDNYIFSSELELSVIEHRIVWVVKMLEESESKIFFPALIYNESFWRLNPLKRKQIISSQQIDWIGDKPIHSTIIYIDSFHLDLIRSIKLSYFNYTKITIENFINIIQTKHNYCITDFKSFGDSDNNILSIINSNMNNFEEDNDSNIYISKILALKFFSNFEKNLRAFRALFFINTFDIKFWDSFFDSIKKLSESKKNNLLEKLKIIFLFSNSTEEAKFSDFIDKISFIPKDSLLSEIIIDYEVNPKEKIDFVYVDSVLCTWPVEVMVRYDNDYYNALGRLVYTNKEHPKRALEDISKLTSPIKSTENLSGIILNNTDIEVSWNKYTHEEIITLLSDTIVIPERKIFRFSIYILKFLINLITNLNTNGQIFIRDFEKKTELSTNIGFEKLTKSLYGFTHDFNLYFTILSEIEDIKITHNIENKNDFISKVISGNGYKLIFVKDLLNFINSDPKFIKSFFAFENFTFDKAIQEKINKVSILAKLKNKNIFSFGIGNILYKKAFNNFYNLVEEDINTKKYLLNKNPKNYYIGNLKLEFIRNNLPELINVLSENSELLIDFKNPENNLNMKVNQMLDSAYIKKDFFYKFIKENIDMIYEFSNSNCEVLVSISAN